MYRRELRGWVWATAIGLCSSMFSNKRLLLADFETALQSMWPLPRGPLDFEDFRVVHPFALTGIAALARGASRWGDKLELVPCNLADAHSRWAWSGMGLQELLVDSIQAARGEPGRTAKLRRIVGRRGIGEHAKSMAELIAPDSEDTRAALSYVFDELMRNVVQHSLDGAGGVACAQRMDPVGGYPHPVIQLAVADNGVGIPSSIAQSAGGDWGAHEAILHAMRPHVSGAFAPGSYGSVENAGMGLFVVSEIIKRTAGRFLVASPGGSLYVEGDPEYGGQHVLRKSPSAYPGNLIAFEIPLIGPEESPFPDVYFGDLLEAILALADSMRPGKDVEPVLNFGGYPPGSQQFLFRSVVGDLDKSAAMRVRIIMDIRRRRPVLVDFANVKLATQSQAHAVLFEPLRIAHALKVPIYVANCTQEVRMVLQFLQGYALK